MDIKIHCYKCLNVLFLSASSSLIIRHNATNYPIHALLNNTFNKLDVHIKNYQLYYLTFDIRKR